MKEFTFKINGAEYKCAVEEIEAGKTNVTVNGKVYTVETEAPAAPAPSPADDTAAIAFALYLASRDGKHDAPTGMIAVQARETAWNTKSIGLNNVGF